MGAIIILLVMIMALVAVPISIAIWAFSLNRIKNTDVRKKIESRSTTISLILWVIIFLFQVDYGSSGSNYSIWLEIWMTKIAIIIFNPSFLALIFSITTPQNLRVLNSDTQYNSLSDAIQAQKEKSKSYEPIKPAKSSIKKDNISKYILITTLVSLPAFLISMSLKLDILSIISISTLMISCLIYLVWLLIRPIVLR